MRSSSGRPVSKISAIDAADPTFCTTTPSETGSLPDGTSTPVTVWINIFSAPCGYFTVSGRTVTSMSVGSVRSSAAIASGLLRSTPMTTRFGAERAHHDARAEMNALRILDHDAMVGREIRLALGAVEDDRLDCVIARRRELDVRRKCRAAESDDAAFLHGATI